MKTQGSLLCMLILTISCSGPRFYCGKDHGDSMRPKYILDTITIERPLLVRYGEDFFVIRESYLESFLCNPTFRPQGIGQQVFLLLPHYDLNDINNGSEFTNRVLEQLRFGSIIYDGTSLEDCVVFRKSIYDIDVYAFDPSPSKFALELVMKNDGVSKTSFQSNLQELQNNVKEESKYYLTVEPLYSRETINEYIKNGGILVLKDLPNGRKETRLMDKLSKKEVKKKGLPKL